MKAMWIAGMEYERELPRELQKKLEISEQRESRGGEYPLAGLYGLRNRGISLAWSLGSSETMKRECCLSR